MLNNRIKYLISGVLVVISLLIIGYGQWYVPKISSPNTGTLTRPDIYTGYVNVPLKRSDIGFPEHHLAKNKIQPLILLEPTACASCLNNLTDYKNLFNKYPIFNNAQLLFMNHEIQTVERFLATTQLDFSYAVIDSLQIPSTLRGEINQNLFFWDAEHEIVFFNEPIPNATTTLESKQILLTQIDSLWARVPADTGL